MADELREEKEKIRRFVDKYCAAHNLRLNPDESAVEMIIEGLARNKINRGLRYCPCRALTGNAVEDKQKACPCLWHKLEIEKEGHCHCGLFFKK